MKAKVRFMLRLTAVWLAIFGCALAETAADPLGDLPRRLRVETCGDSAPENTCTATA